MGLGVLLVPRGIARASSASPTIYTTSDWNARAPERAPTVLDEPAGKIVVHHTVTENSADYSLEHAFSLARSIQNYHMDNNGWIDSGQHFTISRGGYMTEGRHESLDALRNGSKFVESAHCRGQNRMAVGIENEGTYTSEALRTEHYSALVELCVYLSEQYGIDPYEIYGHRDFNATTCPGDELYAMLPTLRGDVAATVGGDPTGVSWPISRAGDSGERVRSVQYLLNEHGDSIMVDGIFGPNTEDAVRNFQSGVGAAVDGIVGNQTWNQAVRDRERGSSGQAVRAVQSQLSSRGYQIAVDGLFGPNTESAVTEFQSNNRIRANGVVDARTWSVLVQ
ncbi:peptidoglycan recognition protein family protein [Haloechinothrix halophila]|uniref:peptidoglycan recognition protein family protein n=1 Tax=Haloechinothrix halophila TaxID=1069073 RepID=UPI001E418D02|nr:N-acetylmuramoyl-L-alanine amidase [Haloechinothrix halophila]